MKKSEEIQLRINELHDESNELYDEYVKEVNKELGLVGPKYFVVASKINNIELLHSISHKVVRLEEYNVTCGGELIEISYNGNRADVVRSNVFDNKKEAYEKALRLNIDKVNAHTNAIKIINGLIDEITNELKKKECKK